MSLTRGDILDQVAAVLGDTSTKMRNHLTTIMNNELFKLWDRHDWEFRHKSGSFNTVSGTEMYDLSASTPDIRASTSCEVMYDKTNGRFIEKRDLKEIRKSFPKEDSSGQPIVYAPWGPKTVFLHEKPDAIYNIKYLYVSKPTLPTDDADDLETVCGLPDYVQPVFYEMVMSKGLFYTDDGRYTAHRSEIESILLPRAIQADMLHLESSARFKFWDEEIRNTGATFDSFLRQWWWGEEQ